jgi:molecular chaperone GrpE
VSRDGERPAPRPGGERQADLHVADHGTADPGTAEAVASDAAPGDEPGTDDPGPDSVEPGDTQGVAPGDERDEQAIRTDLADLERIAAERDEYLDALRRLQADFENYKKRMIKQQTEHLQRAAEDLVAKLLPVLDAVDLARAHGIGDEAGSGLEQVGNALFDILQKEGLQRIDPLGQPFDPAEAEAVVHEAAEEGQTGEHRVTQVMRAGYRWKGRVLRPAMVKVSG